MVNFHVDDLLPLWNAAEEENIGVGSTKVIWYNIAGMSEYTNNYIERENSFCQTFPVVLYGQLRLKHSFTRGCQLKVLLYHQSKNEKCIGYSF